MTLFPSKQRPASYQPPSFDDISIRNCPEFGNALSGWVAKGVGGTRAGWGYLWACWGAPWRAIWGLPGCQFGGLFGGQRGEQDVPTGHQYLKRQIWSVRAKKKTHGVSSHAGSDPVLKSVQTDKMSI